MEFYQKCLKIWFDILTPKQLLFFEPLIKRLRKNNQLLCTSRNYREVVELARIRHMNLIFVGKHGGANRSDKLDASLKRMSLLSTKVRKFAPNLTVSFCSPEAARISYGFGIKHVAFCDSPHAEAVMRLSIPLIQKLYIPWIIKKREFSKYGISEKDVVQYKAVDAAIIVKGKSKNYSRNDFSLKNKKTIVIRTEELQASYIYKNNSKFIIRKLAKEFSNYNIVVLGRYLENINYLKKEFGDQIIILDKVVEGKGLLALTDVFIGSGGTMTAEAALMGIPTISYNAVPNRIEQYLVRKGLIKREKNSKKIVVLVKQILKLGSAKTKEKAVRILNVMEDPFSNLLDQI